jgi:hypothetical protein
LEQTKKDTDTDTGTDKERQIQRKTKKDKVKDTYAKTSEDIVTYRQHHRGSKLYHKRRREIKGEGDHPCTQKHLHDLRVAFILFVLGFGLGFGFGFRIRVRV